MTTCRIILRLPSLYYLYKATSLFLVVLLQACNLFPATQFEWVQSIGQWAAQKEMSDVCWSVYGAVCLALIIGSFTRGLEGISSNNAAPFNLVRRIISIMIKIYAC